MRGKSEAQPDFLTVINLNACVPADHPLRAIQRRLDAVLQRLSPLFDELYEALGRPSIPPEQLLKARVLTALYTVRREQLFCEPLGYNRLWRGVLDREFHEDRFNPSVFSKHYDRGLSADVAKLFFAEVYDLSRQEGWISDDHFTADGTLMESWARLKSFVRKDGADAQRVRSAQDDDPGNPSVNFRGEKRCNDTHQSTTDPDSVLYRKAHGKEAKLCFGGHILMENRHGLCAVAVNGRSHHISRAKTESTSPDWMPGPRRSRYRGQERTQAWGYFVAGTDHLLRMARLELTQSS